MEEEKGLGGERRKRNRVRMGYVYVCATVLNEGNKVHTELLPFQEWASGCSY